MLLQIACPTVVHGTPSAPLPPAIKKHDEHFSKERAEESSLKEYWNEHSVFDSKCSSILPGISSKDTPPRGVISNQAPSTWSKGPLALFQLSPMHSALLVPLVATITMPRSSPTGSTLRSWTIWLPHRIRSKASRPRALLGRSFEGTSQFFIDACIHGLGLSFFTLGKVQYPERAQSKGSTGIVCWPPDLLRSANGFYFTWTSSYYQSNVLAWPGQDFSITSTCNKAFHAEDLHNSIIPFSTPHHM